jgi:hypothetical protein
VGYGPTTLPLRHSDFCARLAELMKNILFGMGERAAPLGVWMDLWVMACPLLTVTLLVQGDSAESDAAGVL